MVNYIKQTFKGIYKMKKNIEFKDINKAADECNELAQFCGVLSANLQNLRKFNRITPLIDETHLFEVSTAERDPESKRELLRNVAGATPFGALKEEESLKEVLRVLTAYDLKERRSLYPQFGEIAPLRSVTAPVAAGRKLRGADFNIKGDVVVATDQVLSEIERASLYRVENETQEKVYNLATGIANNFQELAAIYAKNGMVLNRDVLMRQLFVLSGDTANYRLDERELFCELLPLFK